MAGAIRLLVFTGARLSEILTARWNWIDLEAATLSLPDSKTGRKVIHGNPPALQVVANLTRVEGNPHVIAGRKAGAHLVNPQKPWRLVRARAGLGDVRLHDLRHSFASTAAAGGLSLPLIGAMLGHSQPATTARHALRGGPGEGRERSGGWADLGRDGERARPGGEASRPALIWASGAARLITEGRTSPQRLPRPALLADIAPRRDQ